MPSLKAGAIVLADRYVYTAFARDVARGVEPGMGAVAVSVRGDADAGVLLPRAARGGAEAHPRRPRRVKYYEAGMDLEPERRPQESYRLFQARILDEYERLVQEYGLSVMDASRSVEEQQAQLRRDPPQALTGAKKEDSHDGSI